MSVPRGVVVWARAGVACAAILGVYFVLPPDRAAFSGGNGVVRLAAFGVGLLLLTWLVAAQVRRALRAGHTLADQVSMLLPLVVLVVTAFAYVYYSSAAQFEGLRTRLDALYFSVVTLGTVGYGDIVPTGQKARAIVMIQILFDLIIVTTAITLIVTARRTPPPKPQ